MQRIAVVGAGGAGKTTFALALGRRLGLPVVHLDTLYYGPGWEPVAAAEWELRQRRAVAEDRWIIDGNYAATLAVRLSAADTVVFLDLPPQLCAWRLVRRWLVGRTRDSADLPIGLRHKVSVSFLRYVVTFRSRRQPALLAHWTPGPAGAIWWCCALPERSADTLLWLSRRVPRAEGLAARSACGEG